MSRILYCNLKQRQGLDFVKVKDFGHLSYFTRDFFDQEDNYYLQYDLDLPDINIGIDYEKINDLTLGYKFVNLTFYELKELVISLEKIKLKIKAKYDITNEKTELIEDYKNIIHIIDELKYCLLYSKFELEDTNTIFEFIIK